MNYYENIVILDASLNDENLESAEKRIIETIEKSEGEILKHEKWGLKKLGYEINKHEKGFYIFFIFRSPSTAIKTLENFFKVFDPVFKYMVIKLGEKEIMALQETLQAQESKSENPEDAPLPISDTEGEG